MAWLIGFEIIWTIHHKTGTLRGQVHAVSYAVYHTCAHTVSTSLSASAGSKVSCMVASSSTPGLVSGSSKALVYVYVTGLTGHNSYLGWCLTTVCSFLYLARKRKL